LLRTHTELETPRLEGEAHTSMLTISPQDKREASSAS
jgi:hypothetical protein